MSNLALAQYSNFEKTQRLAKQGEASAQFKLGQMYYHGQEVLQNYKQAFYLYHKAATQGHIKAQFHLGVIYEKGKGVTQNYRKAFFWFQQAALQGHTEAQVKVGYILLSWTRNPSKL